MKPKNLILILITVLALGSGLTGQAIVPPPDGGYPGSNTAEGTGALLFYTSGTYNTAPGWQSLRGISSASFSTGVGAGALALNNADRNTATGAGALLLNGDGNSNTANGALAMVFNLSGANNSAPGLVVRDKEGEIMTVRYDAVNVMLLNEFLKEHRKVQEMQKALGALTTKLEEQAAQI